MFVTSARRLSGASLAVLLALTGCSGSESAKAPAPSPTPISRLDTAGLTVPRIDFCSLVPKQAVSDALGGRPSAARRWGNGDRAAVTPGASDVVHELGCEWRAGEVAARAWIFARPVSEPFARTVVASTDRDRRCPTVPGPAFGRPSATQVCHGPGGMTRVRHAGLFGQTWLSCELADPEATSDLRARADAWCVSVVSALDRVR